MFKESLSWTGLAVNQSTHIFWQYIIEMSIILPSLLHCMTEERADISPVGLECCVVCVQLATFWVGATELRTWNIWFWELLISTYLPIWSSELKILLVI